MYGDNAMARAVVLGFVLGTALWVSLCVTVFYPADVAKGRSEGYCQRACEPEAVVHSDKKECICTTKGVAR